MVERLIFTAILLISGFIGYRVYTYAQLRRISQRTISDPLLSNLKPGIPAIVYFTTPQCIPCRTQQQPALTRLQAELGDDGIQIIKVDATIDPDAASRWGVMSAPTTFVLDRDFHPREVNRGVADEHKLKRQLHTVNAA